MAPNNTLQSDIGNITHSALDTKVKKPAFRFSQSDTFYDKKNLCKIKTKLKINFNKYRVD